MILGNCAYLQVVYLLKKLYFYKVYWVAENYIITKYYKMNSILNTK